MQEKSPTAKIVATLGFDARRANKARPSANFPEFRRNPNIASSLYSRRILFAPAPGS
jgi:hypothetical protein